MEPQITLVPPVQVISRRDRVTILQIPAHSGPAIHSLIEALNRLGVPRAAGAMIYVYHNCNSEPAVPFDLEIALPVPPGTAGRLDPGLELKTLPEFRCLAVDYIGSMTGIGEAWMRLVGAVRAAGLQPTDESREVYRKWVGFDSPENVTELQQGVLANHQTAQV